MVLWMICLAAQVQIPTSGVVNFYTLPREIALGRERAEALRRSLPIVGSPPLAAYISRLGGELAGRANGPALPYTFTVFDNRGVEVPPGIALQQVAQEGELVEPLTLPGGPVFVPLTLLTKLETEPEWAATLAHAIAHAALRHQTRQTTREELVNRTITDMTPEQRRGVVVAIPLGLLTFSRGFEKQADRLAVRILADSGYDPAGLLRYLRKLPPLKSAKAFSMLPAPEQRIAAVETAIRALPAGQYKAPGREFEEIRTILAGIQ